MTGSTIPPLGSVARTSPVTAAPQAAAPVAAAPASAAAEQASEGAAQAQPQPQAEMFNAPMLELPEAPTTKDVLIALTGSMAAANKSSAASLEAVRSQLFEEHKKMTQSIIDGMFS